MSSYLSTTIKKARYLINRDSDQVLVLEKNNGAFINLLLDTQESRDAAISAAVNNILSGAPGALDTLNELAAALNDDANFGAVITTALGNRLTWKGDWAATTAYLRNDVVMFNGGVYVASSNFTSGGTFAKTNWKELSPQFGTNASAKKVEFFAEATVMGFCPIGIDPATGTVFATRDSNGPGLYSTTDVNLQQWTPLKQFAPTETVNAVFVTAAGTVLILESSATAGFIQRSTNGGKTVTQVLTSPTAGCTRRSFAQNSVTGAIVYGEYTVKVGTYTLNLWVSTDDGATWTAKQTWPNAGDGPTNNVRHIHGVGADPFVAGRMWMWTGDGAAGQSFIGYSDDDFTTLTIVGQTDATFGTPNTDQRWRTVDIIFTPTALVWGTDSPSLPQQVYSMDRTTHVLTSRFPDAGNSIYYAGMDSEGRFYMTTTFETGTNQEQREAQLLTGKIEAGEVTVPIQFSSKVPALVGSIRSEIYAYGPLSDGTIFLGIRRSLTSRNTYSMLRGRLIDSKSSGVKQLIAPQSSPQLLQSGFIRINPEAFSTTPALASIGTINRIYFQRFRPDVDFSAKFCLIYIGANASGNLELSLYGSDPTTGLVLTSPLTRTGSVVAGAANTQQQFTFPNSTFLAKGLDYFLGIQGDTAGTTLMGADQKLFGGGEIKFIDGGTFPIADPLPSVPANTSRLFAAILLPG